MKKLRLTKCKFILGGFMAATVWMSCPYQSFANGPSELGTLSVEQTQVKGRVVDQNGEPLIGVSVSVKGTPEGTITDIDGNFNLNCSPNSVLVFSYVGYKTIEMPAKGNLRQIVLKEDSEMLEEVIVVGYGTTTRKSAVGAVDQVRKDMLENRPVANATQALQGAAPNVIIQRRSYNPNNEQTNFNIRGISTTTDNSPLFVIDGLVTDQSAFNKLNPNDIENISILKDAGTAAIYGSRSSNGVVLVTTKGGKKNQKTTVRLTGLVGWEKPDFLFEAVAGYQNAVLTNQQSTNMGLAPQYSQAQIQDYYDHLSEENWALKQIYKTAMQQNYNVNVSGGSDKTTFMVSAGYFDQGSNYNVKNSSLGVQRYNFRTNVSTELGRLKLTAILDYTRTNSKNTTAGNVEIDASRVPAYYTEKMIADDGRYLLTPTLGEYNTIGELNKGGYDKYRTNSLTANLNAELKIIDGLKLRGVFGAEVVGNTRHSRNYPQTYYRTESDTEPVAIKTSDYTSSSWHSDYYRLNSQLLLDYQKSFGKHNVSGLFGATNESYTFSDMEIWKKYVDPDLGTSTGTTTGELGNIGGDTFIDDNSRTSITSFLGRIGYNWNERYYGEFSFRYDGSSKFHEDYRWGFFPSVSAGWRISEEGFMSNYKEKVGDLKIRGSYGILGNQSVGNYDRYTVYSIYASGYGFNNSIVSSAGYQLGLKDLTWERTKTFNIGFDASFFENSLNVTFDYFNKHTVDILMNPTVPSVFGTTMPKDNIGEMKNRGWELAINYRLKTGDFNHYFNFNIADSKNEVVEFPGYEQISSSEELYKIIREGESLYSYYGWETAGLFQSWDEINNSALPSGMQSAEVVGAANGIAPGDVKYVDQNNDGVIDDKDRVVLGNALPRYTFGFTYNLEWKGFDFSMLWQGVGKRDMMLRGELVEPFHDDYSKTIYNHQLDFWTPTNTDARWPRLATNSSGSNMNNWEQASDIFVLDASYLRLKNVVLGYTLPKSWTTRLGVQKLRIYVNAQDMFTFTKNDFIDPESSEMGTNLGTASNYGRSYLPLKYYGFGFDVEF